MKDLITYINECINKSIISKSMLDETIDDFLKDNNITEVTDEIVEKFINANWSGTDEIFGDIIERSYDNYQKLLINETLNDSHDHNALMYFIDKYWHNDIIGDFIDDESNSDTHKITVNLKHDITSEQKFNEIIHFMNYFVKFNKKVNDKYTLILEPFKPSNKTDFIYNECKGIVYHITFEKYYNAIRKRGGLKPKRLNKEELNDENVKHLLYRPSRVYVIASNKDIKKKIMKIAEQTASMDIHKSDGRQIILKIDLSKYQHKINFYDDPANPKDNGAYFTYEFIPMKCLKEINLEDVK